MKRFGLLAVAGLIALLLLIPSANAGDYGCSSSFSNYYGQRTVYYPQAYRPAYSAPVFAAPCYQPPTSSSSTACDQYGNCQTTTATTDHYGNTNITSIPFVRKELLPYAIPTPYYPDSQFRVAPEIAYGRINEEVSASAAKKAIAEFEARLEAREAKRLTEEDRRRAESNAQRQEQLLLQMATMLSQRPDQYPVAPGLPPPPPAFDPEKARLQQEIGELRALLQKMSAAQPPPSFSQPPPPAIPPGVPPGVTDTVGSRGTIGDVVTKGVADSCLQCHGGQRQGRIDLRDLTKLSREDLRDVYYRTTTNNPEEVMPPVDSGKQPLKIEAINGISALIAKTPRKPKAK